jgi:hypothetical protein
MDCRVKPGNDGLMAGARKPGEIATPYLASYQRNR